MFAGLNSVTEELPISNLLFWFQSVRGQQEIILYSLRFKKHMNLMMKTLIKKREGTILLMLAKNVCALILFDLKMSPVHCVL